MFFDDTKQLKLKDLRNDQNKRHNWNFVQYLVAHKGTILNRNNFKMLS